MAADASRHADLAGLTASGSRRDARARISGLHDASIRPDVHSLAFAVTGQIAGASTKRPYEAEDPAELADKRRRVQAKFPEAFASVTDVPGRPRVLLLGDSISIGYTPTVRERLAGVANVHRIPDNGGPTTRGLQLLDTWLGDSPWDVIHFNFGLHDIVRVRAGQPRVSLDDYVSNLRVLIARLQPSGAHLVFATTTPAPEAETHPLRLDADVCAYNEAATSLMRSCGIAINDLYAFARPRLAEIQQPANVHFTDDGYRVLGGRVADIIRTRLRR